MRRGFTIVEIILTLTIMGILLTLAVVTLSSSEANGRDSERQGDAESLATHFEAYYNNRIQDNQGITIATGGTYPGTSVIDPDAFLSSLPDLDPKSARAPGVDVSAPISVVAATNTAQNPNDIQPRPTKDNDIYVYQPLTSSGVLCTAPTAGSECRKFNIYYYQETSGAVQQIMSKNQ